MAEVFTRDFVRFENDRDVSPKGHASPGDVVKWNGRFILPYQTYPAAPTQLCFSESPDLLTWSAPKPFLTEARFLPWNSLKRVIDPTLVLDGETLHCYFVGSANVTNAAGKTVRANLLGHALTRDPKLAHWEILSTNAPLLGVSERAPDGVENVMIFRTGDHWTMIYSEGLADQHLALATSTDLRDWKLAGPIQIASPEMDGAEIRRALRLAGGGPVADDPHGPERHRKDDFRLAHLARWPAMDAAAGGALTYAAMNCSFEL